MSRQISELDVVMARVLDQQYQFGSVQSLSRV